MSLEVLRDVRLYYKGHDLTGKTNNVTLNYSAEMLDRTAFDSDSRKRIAGLKNLEVTAAGFWDSSHRNIQSSEVGQDRLMFDAIGGSSDVISIIPRGTAFGYEAYFSKGLAGEYSPSGSIGELLGFTFNAYGEGHPLIRGRLMHAGPLTTELGSTAIDFKAGATGTRIYAGVHVLGVATGVKLSIEFGMATGVDFGGSKSTMLKIPISTADIGQSKWGSSVLANTSSLVQAYRLTLKNNGASGTTAAGARTNAIIVFGHKKP